MLGCSKPLLTGDVEVWGAMPMRAQGPPRAAPNSGGTPVQPRLATVTCASSAKAQVPPGAAPNSGETPVQARAAAITCACSPKAQGFNSRLWASLALAALVSPF